ncbi:hypothetical protein [Yunchengibacter salinarum]|uniref:hypothetical protein n=1 Tax=Yunchengibacter salinarum TaxID=3133399 RepID=UPI0035B5D0E0
MPDRSENDHRNREPHTPNTPGPTPEDGLTRFRRGTLVALYGALSLLSALLVLAGFFLWPALESVGGYLKLLLLLVAGVVAMLTCARASWDLMTSYFMPAPRADASRTPPDEPAPEFQLVPLFFVALTLFAASWLVLALPAAEAA